MVQNFLSMTCTGLLLTTALAGCGDDSGSGPDRPDLTGSACETPDDCYPDVNRDDLSGEVRCLADVRDGYCTHLCTTDDDCCAADGECATDLRQVCSPFESTGEDQCFLSCEEADLVAAPGADPSDPVDENEYCQREASADFICRSSGGGASNRKICVPADCGVGSGCGGDEDCDPDQTCLTRFRGGYCSVPDCTGNADCPANTVCVEASGGNYCARTCTAASDCSLCRDPDTASDCVSDATLVEPMTVSVCVGL